MKKSSVNSIKNIHAALVFTPRPKIIPSVYYTKGRSTAELSPLAHFTLDKLTKRLKLTNRDLVEYALRIMENDVNVFSADLGI